MELKRETKTCLQDQDLLHLGLMNKTENETEKKTVSNSRPRKQFLKSHEQDPDRNYKNYTLPNIKQLPLPKNVRKVPKSAKSAVLAGS